jgi:hypothetical protein
LFLQLADHLPLFLEGTREAGNMLRLRVIFEPSHAGIVRPDDAGIGHGSLPEVEDAVRCRGELVIVVVTVARETGHHIGEPSSGIDRRDPAAVRNPEAPLMPEQVVDRSNQPLLDP